MSLRDYSYLELEHVVSKKDSAELRRIVFEARMKAANRLRRMERTYLLGLSKQQSSLHRFR